MKYLRKNVLQILLSFYKYRHHTVGGQEKKLLLFRAVMIDLLTH